MDTAPTIIARFLRDVGTFLLFTAWVFGSGWYLVVKLQETRQQLRTRRLTPLPDKRAATNIVGILVVVGLWMLFSWVMLVWVVA